ncbi:hypothetical protein [Psychrobacter sp. I-STPA6b]|uniref:hypothetical protein n=1 Tax=Psychrobacter sp. I-STPA6b TaxID=2585718 RepID=UPI001D0C1771|nr:hypothetical protein [Psychrobacter sp. I-STPA6b]
MSIELLSNTVLEALLGGQWQRVWIAMILVQDTDIIMLIEPTTFLDIVYQIELMKVMKALKEQCKSIIIVLHNLSQASRYCGWLELLKVGKLQGFGTPPDIITQNILADLFYMQAPINPKPISGTPMCLYLQDIKLIS